MIMCNSTFAFDFEAQISELRRLAWLLILRSVWGRVSNSYPELLACRTTEQALSRVHSPTLQRVSPVLPTSRDLFAGPWAKIYVHSSDIYYGVTLQDRMNILNKKY